MLSIHHNKRFEVVLRSRGDGTTVAQIIALVRLWPQQVASSGVGGATSPLGACGSGHWAAGA